jgi:hypothetical protein
MSGGPNRARALDRSGIANFRIELYQRISAWPAEPGATTRLADAWWLLAFDVIAEVAEQACRDSTGGYALSRNDDRTGYVVRWHDDDLARRRQEAVVRALDAGELLAEGFGPSAPPDAH